MIGPRHFAIVVPDGAAPTHVVSTSCFLTSRGWVHVADLEPLEAWDLAPILHGAELEQLRPIARSAARSRLAIEEWHAARRRRAA